jgi:hypothetical protein
MGLARGIIELQIVESRKRGLDAEIVSLAASVLEGRAKGDI